MPFTLIRKDITTCDVDAIVNAANTELRAGGGVCGAIFAAAGKEDLARACAELAPITTGEAVITPGFALAATFVIHTAGPIYSQHSPAEAEQYLRSCYRRSLSLAHTNGVESIAFPLISSGIYGYPKEQALEVAEEEILRFISTHEMDVYLALFDPPAPDRSSELSHFIAASMEDPATTFAMRGAPYEADGAPEVSSDKGSAWDLDEDEDFLPLLDVPFSTMLMQLITAKGLTDVEVYKRANLDRRLFSKIRSGKGYMPSKKTAVALAIALELDLDETNAFLGRAGFALSRGVLFDVIIEYFIRKKNYNIYAINEVLFSYDQQLLGA